MIVSRACRDLGTDQSTVHSTVSRLMARKGMVLNCCCKCDSARPGDPRWVGRTIQKRIGFVQASNVVATVAPPWAVTVAVGGAIATRRQPACVLLLRARAARCPREQTP